MAEQENKTQSDDYGNEYSINDAHYKQPKSCGEEVDRHNAEKNLDENLSTDWKEEPTIPGKYSAYCDKFTHILTQSESMCNGHLGSIKAV